MSGPSRLESERFGIPIARATLLASDDVDGLLTGWQREGIAMAVVRVDVADVAGTHALERRAGRLCDTLVYYRHGLRGVANDRPDERIRTAVPGDAAALGEVAARAFAGYAGHYHADPRLDPRAATEGYADWARRSLTDPGVADHVWVAEVDERIVGFLTLRANAPDETEIVLNAVDPPSQRRGIYTALVQRALQASVAAGVARTVVSTQLANIAVQRIWVRAGFEPLSASHTFHLWLDEVPAAPIPGD